MVVMSSESPTFVASRQVEKGEKVASKIYGKQHALDILPAC